MRFSDELDVLSLRIKQMRSILRNGGEQEARNTFSTRKNSDVLRWEISYLEQQKHVLDKRLGILEDLMKDVADGGAD